MAGRSAADHARRAREKLVAVLGGDRRTGGPQAVKLLPHKQIGAGTREGARAFRSLADAARDRSDWPTAAYYYGRLLSLEPGDAALWLQHGHMLKESGLLSAAGESYRQARERAPNDPEIPLQTALLDKQLCRVEDARRNLELARQLGYPDDGLLQRELRFLREMNGQQSRDVLLSSAERSPLRIFLSSAVQPLRQESADSIGNALGLKNYSYAFIVKGYREALDALGLPYEFIGRPEFVPDIRERSRAEVNLHLGFYPPDEPRLLKGAYNVMVVAWEFERLQLPHELMQAHAFSDPAAMLALSDEVWCLSDFGAEALRRSAKLPAVSTVPTPVLSGVLGQARSGPPKLGQVMAIASRLEHVTWWPLAVAGTMQMELYQEGKRRRTTLRTALVERLEGEAPAIFLAVLNVFDARKQLRPMLEAFIQLTLEHPNCYLLLKLSFPDYKTGDPNEAIFLHQVVERDHVAPILVSDRVLITSDVLSRDDLNALYDAGAFYVSTSHGEGQNLPLLEAMGRGMLPVSVDHTAMRDYIGPDDAVVIPSTLQPFTPRLSGRYGLRDTSTYFVSPRDVLAALREALALQDADYAVRSAAALEAVKQKFSAEPLRVAVERSVDAAKRSLHVREDAP